MNARIREAREAGASKREAKRIVYGRTSRHTVKPAPLALYRRLHRAKALVTKAGKA